MASVGFDRLASGYDRAWTNSNTGIAQREAVWRHIAPLFSEGDSVLDLGCGTGEDAVRLTRRGIHVRALDASQEMVAIARSRGVDARVGRIEAAGQLNETYAAVISNFGALNCIADLPSLREPLARLVRPSGFLAICVMSRFCLSESLHYLGSLQLARATRRWSGRTHVERLSIDVFYPRARQLQRAFAPDFHLIRKVGIGLAVPPSYVSGISAASMRIRQAIDERIAHRPMFRSIADHQLFIFVRSKST